MSQTVLSVYKDIMEQVMIRERFKKDISRQILMAKNPSRRLKLIYNFLNFDLDKHKLLECAAVVGVSNNEPVILDNLKKFYANSRGDEILDKIRIEIIFVSRYIDIISQEISNPGTSTFLERRMIQEISKYVKALARIYSKNNVDKL